MSKASEQHEIDLLTEEQRTIYFEAIDCGATHNDALDAVSWAAPAPRSAR